MTTRAPASRLPRRPAWVGPALLALIGGTALVSAVAGLAFPVPAPELDANLLPPVPLAGSAWAHPLGTDGQGRDLLAATLDGARLSIAVASLAVAGACGLGLAIGLTAGRAGGALDAALMRAADVQMSFPPLMAALLADAAFQLGERGLAEGAVAPAGAARIVLVLAAAIALGRWPPIARLARAAARREWRRDYVAAARLAGRSGPAILLHHVLPNALPSVLAVAALDVGLAVLDESTLSFLGLGLPADQPSLGTLVRDGEPLLFAGAWWAVLVPGCALALLVASAVALADRVHPTDPSPRA